MQNYILLKKYITFMYYKNNLKWFYIQQKSSSNLFLIVYIKGLNN